MNYMVSNVGGRDHQAIFGEITSGAFFDLTPKQHGWADYSRIAVNDRVYVIGKDRKITDVYRVTGIVDGILLEESSVWGTKALSLTGGTTRALFGERVDCIDQSYFDFVLTRNIVSPKINPTTGKMYPGFNCVAFS